MRQGIFFILSLLFLLFSLWPTGYELYNRNQLMPERAFELIHNFPTDYNFYLSRIRQGIEGRITVVEKYTSEQHNGSFIHVFYLGLGWIGRFVHVPWERGGDVYHMARIVFGLLLLLLVAEYAKKVFPKSLSWALVAFLLAVSASTWPKLVFYNGGWRFGGYMPWWSVMDSLQRITFVPHLLVGQALILFLIMAMSDEATMKKSGNWIFLGFLAFILGIIFPPGLLFVYATSLILIGVEWILYRKVMILPKAVVCLLGLPSLLYLQLMTTFYPWKRLAEQDILNPLPFAYAEYLKAVGYILPFGLIGLVVAFWNKEKAMIGSIAWVLSWIFLLIAFHFVPQQSPLRFSEMIPHVPLAILTVSLFFHISHLRILSNLGKKIIITIPIFMISVGLGVMVSSWWWQRDFIDHKMRASYPLVPTGSYVMYPLKDFLAAMKFIQDATPRDTVILSETTAGNYLPVYSGNTVYVGHANTVRAEEKEAQVKLFFSGRMTVQNARTWLATEHLSYMFFGPQEKEDGGIADLVHVYPFLKTIYKNNYVTVYELLPL